MAQVLSNPSLATDGALPWFDTGTTRTTSDEEAADALTDTGPAWPVILLHAALNLLSTGLGFAAAYQGLGYDRLISAVVALCTLFVTFGPLGLALSWAVGSPAVGRNLAWGCGLIAGALLFFGLCALLGMVAAVMAQVVVGG